VPEVATPGLVEIVCQLNGAMGSGPHYNIFHIDSSSDTAGSSSAAVAALNTFYTTLKFAYRNLSTMIVGYKVIDRSTVPWSFVPVTPLSVTGTGAGGPFAPQLAAVITWRTPLVGKSYRGRTFLGPFDASASGGALWLASVATAMTTASNALIAASNAAATWKLSIYSAKHNTLSHVSSSAASQNMRTMRSRA
jgi:hypothetical protein